MVDLFLWNKKLCREKERKRIIQAFRTASMLCDMSEDQYSASLRTTARNNNGSTFPQRRRSLLRLSEAEMLQKKIFLFLVGVCMVSLLLRWTMGTFHLNVFAPCSQASPGLKPKRTNVVFLKTHKTGSSTVQNLLFRFAQRHKLTVAFPVEECRNLFCYPRSFNASFVHPATLPANIITNHMRFNHAELRRVMPNNTAYITILREPASMFESMFTYFKRTSLSFRNASSLEAFMEEPQRYYQPNEPKMAARNALTFDLGGDNNRPETDAAYVRDFVAEVDRSFSLVMIAEHFDESLVLLRRLLSWDLDDVLYVKLNMRAAGSKHASLAPGLAAKMRAWNHLDAWLYDHFNASLWRKLAALGPACVAEELRLLRQAQQRRMQSCFGERMPQLRPSKQIKNKNLRPYQPSNNVDIMGYDLPANISHPSDLCLQLIMPEVQYSKILLDSQTQRFSGDLRQTDSS